LGKKKKKKKF
jgi:hypothetical protein